jgi:uncharacterized caspase-like protein
MFIKSLTVWLATTLVVALTAGASVAAERRVALIIGNAAYTGIQRLQNPVSDATEIDRALRALGFQTLVLVDARKPEIDGAIRRFRDLVRGADVGLFYYSGHGFQTSRASQHHPVNHIVPVDFHIPAGRALENTVPLDDVLGPLEAARVSLVFMDACRNDPQLEQASRRASEQSRSVVLGRGFAPVAISPAAGRNVGASASDSRPAGMLIAYAAAPGSEAMDGDDRVSPFTKSLLKHIASTGVPIFDIMGRVGKDVQRETNNRQRPWYVSELTAPFYLVPQPRRPSGTVIPP